ncbi:MAG: hypothetical protein E6I11_05805 [Chloroflexi bacterium]|nr:MAG: hypothetical protein E6I11_05805 [Chloroflexota bacterium]TMG10443.1 MAG: hypothetical protein E6I00_12900 [Chloroflexota bacterium]
MKWSLREGSLVTAVAALVLVVQPDILAAVVRVWIAVLALLATGAVLKRVFGPIPAEPPPVHSVTARELGLVRGMSENDQAKDFLLAVDYQLFPFLQGTLREIAAQRLLVNHRVVLERDPDRARKILGDDAWQLVRPTPEGSDQPRWDAVTIAQLDAVTDALEKA